MPFRKLSLMILLFVFNQPNSNAQCDLKFRIRYQGNDLKLDSVYRNLHGEDSEINVFRFYISSIGFLFADGSTFNEPNSYHLIESSEPTSQHLKITDAPSGIIKTVFFNLGIDSLTNVSGAMGGDLDPTKGMYWTWQNGYINCKLEGKNKRCLNPKHEFQYHLGGYQFPFASLQKIALACNQSNRIIIDIDLEEFMRTIDFEKNAEVASPDVIAVEFSEKLAQSFTVKLK
ncbi:hypothetical protein BH11BAC2_BH11BAC2_16500 [soil metagenome]